MLLGVKGGPCNFKHIKHLLGWDFAESKRLVLHHLSRFLVLKLDLPLREQEDGVISGVDYALVLFVLLLLRCHELREDSLQLENNSKHEVENGGHHYIIEDHPEGINNLKVCNLAKVDD